MSDLFAPFTRPSPPAVLLLVLLNPAGSPRDRGTVEAGSLRRYRTSVTQALSGFEIAASERPGGSPGGTA